MSLEILTAGPMLTVQDAGRFGLRHMGVSPAGPIDRAAMALANALVGNDPGAAALEFAGPAGRFRCDRPVRFAVAGADCALRIDARTVSPGESHRLNPGETLTVGVPEGAVWAYLAVSGAIASPEVLGSRATHLRSGVGGRALAAGDRLPLGEDDPEAPCLRPGFRLEAAAPFRETGPIRLILGPQDDHFAPEVIARLTGCDFTVTPQRDRMAMVLGGVELPAERGHDIVSDGTVPGSVQVPGSGLPLVLLAESQTTGGYPKIGTVASADLARLAQMPVGARFRFALISAREGEDLWIARQARLRRLLEGLVARPEGLLRSDYLLSCDLVGGFYAPGEVVRPVTRPAPEDRP
ncbi:biotin-dependent carboxyltransferase family protein [Cereibacter sediminicola]|uniref:5-oxoprolinase subunit C family protein n=1 Tax=Cereibacter sediminicola TaxID=2584941 RepID=UPI0011A76E7C|nr:biotin-dependent carboxyltransferase family protein [Cereibacter sediminicola]